uniref:Uncharacterized protein n=1 Tax=Poecilia reticulata TaxID=8081 RepID=A0A3P9MVR3_POERE
MCGAQLWLWSGRSSAAAPCETTCAGVHRRCSARGGPWRRRRRRRACPRMRTLWTAGAPSATCSPDRIWLSGPDTPRTDPGGCPKTPLHPERTIKTTTLKEHPYSSHISRFAMFPSFLSPDDPERGVRAASQSFINTLIPNKPPDVTLLSKTIGGPYRHEILENPVKSRKMAVSWTGENGFLDVRETQIFYPAPPKTILPNPKLRPWNLSLSERTGNILRNLERELWITSYQMDFTGSGPANPLKTDDFKEKISTLNGINSHSAPLVNHILQFLKTETNSTELQKEDPQIKKQPLGVGNPLGSKLHDALSNKEDDKTKGGELRSSRPNVSFLPRRSVFSGSEAAGRTGTTLTLLDLQNSFSKSEAHRRFSNSITHAAVDLRHNVVTGKRHNFYGVNCNHIHG